MAKDFKGINTNKQDTGADSGKVYEAIEKGKDRYQQQAAASKQEQLERSNSMRTQGRKGCKQKRINLAFSADNYEYISVMSKSTGRTLTGFINDVIERDRLERNPELYATAKKIIEELNMEKQIYSERGRK